MGYAIYGTPASLKKRIETHNKYSKYEITDWIFKLLDLKNGECVLDVGCGSGKQTIAYAKAVPLKMLVGVDISAPALRVARMRSKSEGLKISFIKHDVTRPFKFKDESFDLTSCCHAIYYFPAIEKFLREVNRLLCRGGRIFITGPTVNNSKRMIALHSKIIGRKVSQFREKRMRDEVIPVVKKIFQRVKIHIFNNTINFPNAQTFLDYYASTLLFKESSDNLRERIECLNAMRKEVDDIVKKEGIFELRKKVYGILGYKDGGMHK